MVDRKSFHNRLVVDMEPVGRRIDVPYGTTLLEAAQAAGVDMVSVCGGAGTCGACRITLMSGELSPLSLTEAAELDEDEIQAGMRLACQAEVRGPVRIHIPPGSLATPQRLQIEGEDAGIEVDPLLQAVEVELEPPNLFDLRSDLERLEAGLANQGVLPPRVPRRVLTSLSDQLRAQDWKGTIALRDGSVAGLLPSGSPLVGLAADLGTTKLAIYLVDLRSGKTIARAGAMNPQIAYGEDVVARIAYANDHPDGRQILQSKLIDTINAVTAKLCTEAGLPRQSIVESVFVGNTAMHHLFTGLPVAQLGMAPYVPAVSRAMEFQAEELGLGLAPGASVYLPPNIAGYVGADHVSMLLAAHTDHDPRTVVALDIGTNTEISLFHQGRHLACSCASGPAFEGAHIQDGMRAAAGAIERVRIDGKDVYLFTIGGQPPVGICGSGILDAVAQMRAAGVIDHRGVLGSSHIRRTMLHGKPAFVLADASTTGHGRSIVLTRQDVNEIQLAKGAIRAGVEILLMEAGITASHIDEFVVAGAFGTYLNLRSALEIGMFPPIPVDRYRQVGNAAGAGAKKLLLSGRQRKLAGEMGRQVEYIELTTHSHFSEVYVQALSLN